MGRKYDIPCIEYDDLYDSRSASVTEAGFNEEFILIMFLLVILYSSMDLQESQYERDDLQRVLSLSMEQISFYGDGYGIISTDC